MFKQKARLKQNRPGNLLAPLAGINAVSPLMALRPDEAIVLENFFPASDGLATRDGYVSHATGLPSPADRLWVYSQATGGQQLFATTDTGVYEVTSAGAVGAVKIALTEGETSCSSISTGAGAYLLLANGVDTVKLYDGTTWSAIATFGALATSTLSYVETYRQRLFFAKRNSLELEYLSANSIAGASTNYPLGAIFRRGGYIVALATWTIDGGTGPEDNLVVMTSQGEVAVFAGSLPSDPTLWKERGVYYIGKPLGKQPLYKWGGDLLVLTETGLYPLSTALQSTSIDRTKAVSNKIQPLFSEAAGLYSASMGWQIIADPLAPSLIVNIPASPIRKQFVMNTETKAWTVFSGWDARCLARMGQEIYFGTSTAVKRVNGVSDEGANIVSTLLQAPTRLGLGYTKKVELLKPYISQNGGFTYTLALAPDLGDPKEYTQISGRGQLSAAIWGTAVYGAAYWTGDVGVEQSWQTVADDFTLWKSLYLQIVSNNANIRYFGADYLTVSGGNL